MSRAWAAHHRECPVLTILLQLWRISICDLCDHTAQRLVLVRHLQGTWSMICHMQQHGSTWKYIHHRGLGPVQQVSPMLTSPCASSSSRMPKDQMSARSSYPFSFGATTCRADTAYGIEAPT
jgi:hypothetical protein